MPGSRGRLVAPPPPRTARIPRRDHPRVFLNFILPIAVVGVSSLDGDARSGSLFRVADRSRRRGCRLPSRRRRRRPPRAASPSVRARPRPLATVIGRDRGGYQGNATRTVARRRRTGPSHPAPGRAKGVGAASALCVGRLGDLHRDVVYLADVDVEDDFVSSSSPSSRRTWRGGRRIRRARDRAVLAPRPRGEHHPGPTLFARRPPV